MAFSDKPKFTSDGKQLMALATAGEITLKFTKIKMGDGVLSTQSVTTLTDLINPVVTLDITAVSGGNDYITLQSDFDNAQLSAGFYWREVGVYAEDPDGGNDILYCYGNCGELAEYIASAGEQTIRKIIAVSAIIGDAENVTAEISDSTYYSPHDLLQAEISQEDLMPFFDTVSGKKNITFEMLVNAIGALLGISDLSSHIKDYDNPHNVSAKQIGLDNVDNTADVEKRVAYANKAGSSEECTGNAATATKLKLARTIDGVAFNGNSNINHFAVCETAGNTVEKTVAKIGYYAFEGSWITVLFKNTNTAENPTLNVNDTGAKAIYYKGSPVEADMLSSGDIYIMIYTSGRYEIVGDLHIGDFLPLIGGLLTGTLSISEADGYNTGGNLKLIAGSNPVHNGIYIRTMNGKLYILGIPSADGVTKVGEGTALVIDPYAKTITGGYSFDGTMSKVATGTIAAPGTSACTINVGFAPKYVILSRAPGTYNCIIPGNGGSLTSTGFTYTGGGSADVHYVAVG